jgi:hypothetical protein
MSTSQEYPQRPGISERILRAAEIRYSDYPEPGSIEIPYWTADGDLTRFKRWRLSCVRANDQKYHQEKGTDVHAYFPPGYFRRNGEVNRFELASDTIFLVEGEFKTLSLLESGVWAIGIPSFTVYQRDENENRRLLRDLQVTFAKEKPGKIYYLGDSDTATNFEFSRNAEFLASVVNPTKVFLPRIPIDKPKGIDDCREILGAGFDIFFTNLIQTAIELPRKIEAPVIALMLLEREAKSLKVLKGLEREKQFERIIKLCLSAQNYDRSQATLRLCKLVCEIIGLSSSEFKAATKDRRAKDARERNLAQYTEASSSRTESEQKTAHVTQKTEKQRLILPSWTVEFEKSAEDAFPVLAKRHRYFVRDRLLVEIAYQKPMKDKQRHDVFQLLEPDAFRSRLEKDFNCFVWREQGGAHVLKPGRCSHDAARVMLLTDEAFKYLPTISFLSAQPVYTVVHDKPEILYRGYHDVHGGIYVSHGDKDHPIILPDLETAVDLILCVVKDYDFVSLSDKSRAVAFFISPTLRTGKFLGPLIFQLISPKLTIHRVARLIG